MKVVGLALIFFIVWAIGNYHVSIKGVVSNPNIRTNPVVTETPEDVQVERGYVILSKDSVVHESVEHYYYTFKRFSFEEIASMAEYKVIKSQFEVPPESCFEYKGVVDFQHVFTYDYADCHEYDVDFKLAGVMIVWSDNTYSVVTNLVKNFKVELNQPYYSAYNIIIEFTPKMYDSLDYYVRKGEVKSVIFYIFTRKKGMPVYLEFEVSSMML